MKNVTILVFHFLGGLLVSVLLDSRTLSPAWYNPNHSRFLREKAHACMESFGTNPCSSQAPQPSSHYTNSHTPARSSQ